MLRGSPGPGKRAKRVPPVPTPQVGTATAKSMARLVIASISMPRLSSWRAEAVVVLGEGRFGLRVLACR